ncbi:hypothetical protein KCU95_g3630, partial [Aureobasidium melanogenum]
MAHNSSILLDLQTSSSARSLLCVAGSPPLAFQATTNCAAQAQAMERIVVGENVSRVPRYKLDKKAKTVKTTKEPGDGMLSLLKKISAGKDTGEVLMTAGKNGNLHASQKDQIPRQRVPAPPPHVLISRRETYIANVLTASISCTNDSQHFHEFTVESQEQWIALLESYKDVGFRKFTPAYEEVPDILERLRAYQVWSLFQLKAQQGETCEAVTEPRKQQIQLN